MSNLPATPSDKAGSQITPAMYLRNRVDDQITYYEQAANSNKRKRDRLQKTIIILGILIPVITNLSADWFTWVGGAVFIQATVTLFSVMLAIATGLLNFGKYGDLWLSYRTNEELLKREKLLFQTTTRHYRGLDDEERFAMLVDQVEALLSTEHEKFRALIEDQQGLAQQQKP